MSHLLEVRNLQTQFETRAGLVRAVDGVSFHLACGELMGLVGESGCGKSITALSIMRLIGSPGKIVGGEINFDGKDLLRLSDREMRQMRGDDLAMIFQDPMTSLNPVFTVGEQIAEALRLTGSYHGEKHVRLRLNLCVRCQSRTLHGVLTIILINFQAACARE